MKQPNLHKVAESLPDDDYPFPRYVIVEPTNTCNLRCEMCPSSKQTRARGVMELDLFKKIVDEITEKSPQTVIWPAVMGEALVVQERFLQMLEYAREKKARIAWNTNGVLLNSDVIDRLGRFEIEEIIVGLDAVTQETYAKIRTGGDFARVVQNVKTMLGKRWSKTRITVQFITQENNETEEDAFVRYWIDRGAVVKVRQRLGWGKGVGANNLRIPQELRTMPCPWLIRTMSVHWDGTTVQCDADWNAEHPVGNLRDMSIEDAWQNKLRERRLRHRKMDFKFEPCSSCNDWQAGLSEFHIPEDPSLPAAQLERTGARA